MHTVLIFLFTRKIIYLKNTGLRFIIMYTSNFVHARLIKNDYDTTSNTHIC